MDVANWDAVVALPGGLVLESGRCLAEAELRPLTGREEDWLSSSDRIPSAVAVTRLLEQCLVRLGDVPVTRDLVRRMLIGDRDYLMLQLRRITLGDAVRAVLVCPACGANIDVDFVINEIPIERRPQEGSVHTLTLPESDSAGSGKVRFRLPTGADQEAVSQLGPEAADTLFARCLVDSSCATLSAEQREATIQAMERAAPQVELELELSCPECAHAFVAPFDTTAFFLSEMRQRGGQLLREVHHLAFHYHWSEAEILGLTRDRRRAYLGLLSDALRQE